MARKPLYQQEGQDPGGEIVLKKRKKLGCLAKFLITLAISVVLFFVTAIVGLLIGNGILKSNFGVSLFDLLGCMSDLKNVKAENVITNPYEESDTDGFYVALNSSLFLNDGVIDAEYFESITDASSSGGDVTGTVTSILSRESFSADKLAAYNSVSGTNEGNTVITDRQLAAFLNDFLIDSGKLDEISGDVSSLLGDGKLSDVIKLEQAILQSGADMSEEDKVLYGADNEGVYLTVTFSFDVKTTIKGVLDNAGAGGFVWIANMILPETAYLSATFDLTDAEYGVKLNVNDMDRQSCKMNYLSDEMKAKYGEDTSQYDRLCIIIEGFSGTDVNAMLSENLQGLTSFLCKSDSAEGEAPFCFADIIDLDSVAALPGGGNQFGSNALEFMTNSINSASGGNATEADIVALMQSLICTDYDDAYGVENRVDLYAEDITALEAALEQCGFTSVTDIRSQSDLDKLKAVYSGIAYDEPAAPIGADMTNVYDQVFVEGFAEAYGIDMNKYEGGGDSGTPVGKYTFSDIMSVAETSDVGALTAEQQELLRRIGLAYAEGEASGNAPVFGINDKMLGAVLRELSDMYDTESGISLRSVKLTESSGKKYADLVFTLDAGGLISDETLGGLLPEYISVGVRAEVTEGKGTVRDGAKIISFNGLTEDGGVAGIEELTCERLLDALGAVLPAVNFDEILTSVSDGLNQMVDNISEYFPGAVFVTE